MWAIEIETRELSSRRCLIESRDKGRVAAKSLETLEIFKGDQLKARLKHERKLGSQAGNLATNLGKKGKNNFLDVLPRYAFTKNRQSSGLRKGLPG